MSEARTYVITGTSGRLAGAAKAHFEAAGNRVIGVDVAEGADVVVDLSVPQGRAQLVEQVGDLTGGRVDAVISAAAMVGVFADTARVVRTNYFGAVATLEGLRGFLAHSPAPRAVAFASVSLLHQPVPRLVDACLSGDEDAAAAIGETAEDHAAVYTTTKRALARWVRRQSVTPQWAGAGITLNAVAPGITRHETLQWDPTSEYARYMDVLEPRLLAPVSRPAHVVALLDWLTSVDNAATTGQVIFIDGGTEALLRGDDLWPGHWPDPHPSAPTPPIAQEPSP